ncbi:hypothetical protein K438DRAFT_180280 [Mycena galopus ATCC 62051]|nr:hypothetical protein K438DRAFT_180280 [Mycena galopus ATCC 62051]
MSHSLASLTFFFIDTSTIATIDAGLKNIAVMKDSGNSQQDGLLWLTSKVKEWLLFFDNADDPSLDLNDFIPACNHGNIIITSRNPELCLCWVRFLCVRFGRGRCSVIITQECCTTIHTEQTATEIVQVRPLSLKTHSILMRNPKHCTISLLQLFRLGHSYQNLWIWTAIWLYIQRTKQNYSVKSLLSLMTVMPIQYTQHGK